MVYITILKKQIVFLIFMKETREERIISLFTKKMLVCPQCRIRQVTVIIIFVNIFYYKRYSTEHVEYITHSLTSNHPTVIYNASIDSKVYLVIRRTVVRPSGVKFRKSEKPKQSAKPLGHSSLGMRIFSLITITFQK